MISAQVRTKGSSPLPRFAIASQVFGDGEVRKGLQVGLLLESGHRRELDSCVKDLKSRVALADSSKSAGQAIRSSGMETRFYPAESKEDVDALMTALTSFVFPGSWETDGGEGVMVEVGIKLVIRQTPEVHKAIADFILELQSAGATTLEAESSRR